MKAGNQELSIDIGIWNEQGSSSAGGGSTSEEGGGVAHPGVHYTSQNIVVCERGLRVPKHVISCLYHLLDTFDLRSACCAQCVSMGSPARCLSIGRVHGISTRPHLFALVVASIARVWGRAPLVVAGRPWLWPPTTSSAAGVERTSKMSEQRVVGSTSLLLKPSRVYCCAFSCILSPPRTDAC